MNLHRICLLLVLPASTCLAAPDDELDSPPTLTTVDVTAAPPARDEGAMLTAWGSATLQDTPATITVIDRAWLDTRQPRTLSELARLDPALGDNYAPEGYYQNLSIRGYALDLGTGYRANDLVMTGEQRIALEDKQAVEILKGLAGLEAGVMEPGGVVNFVSKRSADVRAVTLGTDARGSRYAAFDVGAWLTPSFGLRANAAWEDLHSYIEHGDGRRNFLALAADWHPTPEATLEFDANYQTSAQRSASGYQLLGGSVMPSPVDRRRMLGYQAWQEPVAIVSSDLSARYTQAFGADWRLRLAAAQSRSVIDDNVAFAYGCFYQDSCADNPPGAWFAPDGGYDIYDYRSPDDRRVGRQLRATLEGSLASGALTHELSLGGDAFARTIDRHVNVNAWVGSANIDAAQVPPFAPSSRQPGPSVRRLASWQHAVFAADRVSLGEQWQLIAGARLARVHDRAWSKRGELERDTRLDQWLPQAALLWLPSNALTTYLSYSEGLSLGKEAPWWTSNDGATLGPRHSRQLELGAKYRMAAALDLGAALYRIRLPWQFAQPDASAAGYTFVERGEEVHTGLELSAHGRVGESLRIDAGLNFIRAQGRRSGTPAYEGHQVVNVPRLRASVQLDYTLPASPQLGLVAGWRFAARNPATPDGRIGAAAYQVFDLGLRYTTQWQQHPLTWRLAVDNVFDRFYWRDTGSSDGDNYLFPGAPRSARLTLTLGF